MIEKRLQLKLNYSIFSIAVAVVVVGKYDTFQKTLNGQLFVVSRIRSNEKIIK